MTLFEEKEYYRGNHFPFITAPLVKSRFNISIHNHCNHDMDGKDVDDDDLDVDNVDEDDVDDNDDAHADGDDHNNEVQFLSSARGRAYDQNCVDEDDVDDYDNVQCSCTLP